MSTDVELLWQEGQIERWVRFGRPAAERLIDRRRRVLSFAPGAVFALVRWQANDFGTAQSRIDILRAVRTGEHKLVAYPEACVVQLFDLQADPWETTNLAGDRRHQVEVPRPAEEHGGGQHQRA